MLTALRNPSTATISLRQRRRWFDGDGTPPPVPDPAAGDSAKPKKPDDKSGTQPPVKTFTQEELDSIVGNRSKESRQAAVNELLKKLGLDSEDDLVKKVAEHKKAEEARLSEAEKLTKRADTAEAEKAEALKKLAVSEAARLRDRLENAVLLAAKDALAVHADDVWLWLNTNMSDDLTKAIGDDGKVNDKQIESLIGKVKEARPTYFEAQRRSPGSPSNHGGHVPDPAAPVKQQAAKAQAQNLRNRF